MNPRTAIVFTVAVATYLVGRSEPGPPVLALFALAVALALYAHLSGRGDDRFAAAYAAAMGGGAGVVAGLLGWIA